MVARLIARASGTHGVGRGTAAREPYWPWESRPGDIQGFPVQAGISMQNNAMGGIGGQIDNLDPDKSCFAMGQSAGGIHDVMPAGEIVRRLMAETHAAISRLTALNAASPAKAKTAA